MRTALDLILADVARFAPDVGFNVVGRDDFEAPGEMLYLVASCSTRAEAEAIVAARRKADADEVLFIYEASA